jgi:hypothetical protein
VLINDHPLPPKTLVQLRSLLGDERVDELCEIAHNVCQTEARTADERICFAEHFRLFAEAAARREGA